MLKNSLHFLVASALLVLSACQSKQPIREAKKMQPWGYYKCISVTPLQERFTGWAALEERARQNAITLCKMKTHDENCTVKYCFNDQPSADDNKKS